MELGVIRTYIRGFYFEFLTAPGVFSRRKLDLGTRLLTECMVLPEKGIILDLGCGYGPVGIVAATINPTLHVIMTDVNERAVWLTKQNIKRNNIRNAEVRQGSLYEPVSNMQFNTILSNPPVTAGMKTAIIPLIHQARNHLKKDGTLQLVVRTGSGGKRIGQLMEETFQNVEVVDRKSGYRIYLSKQT